MRRSVHRLLWRLFNPLARPLAGIVPWWVLVETKGRRTRRVRQVPLATGPSDDDGMWVAAVHGRSAAWVKNIEADPLVRVRTRRKWRAAVAQVCPYDVAVAAKFNPYARGGPALFGIDPCLVHLQWATRNDNEDQAQ